MASPPLRLSRTPPSWAGCSTWASVSSGRALPASLTGHGRTLLKRAETAVRAADGRILAKLTAAQQREFKRMLDKLGSVKDFSEFLHTPAGARFMHDLAAEPQASDGPKQRILRAAQLGIVLSSLGLGLLALSFFWSPYASDNGQTTFASLGVIALSLGIGFGVSAAASYRVSGALGLLGGRESSAGAPATSEV